MSREFDVRDLVGAIRKAAGRDGALHLHEPWFPGNEEEYVRECVSTGWVSSAGSFVDRIERDLAAITGHAHAVAVVNGTAGLHAALHLVGVEPGDEVIVPALTFVATANAVTMCGAVPHFVDIEESTLGLDSAALAQHLADVSERRGDACINRTTGRRIQAVMPMHTFGIPTALDPLSAVCANANLTMVEDAAEALGSTYGGRHVGHHGRIAVLSFNGNKIVTTGGGGALLFDDEELAARAKHVTTTAKLPHRWDYAHDEFGFNYRMPNLNAALGCAQLERLPEFLDRKRALHERYIDAFKGRAGASLIRTPEGSTSNHWLNAILLDREHVARRDEILDTAHDSGIHLRPVWRPLHELPMYTACPRAPLPVTEDLAARLINLPSSASL